MGQFRVLIFTPPPQVLLHLQNGDQTVEAKLTRKTDNAKKQKTKIQVGCEANIMMPGDLLKENMSENFIKFPEKHQQCTFFYINNKKFKQLPRKSLIC